MQRISFSKLSLYLIGNPRQSYYHYSTSPITTLFSLTPVSLLADFRSSLNLISFPPPYIIALTVTNNQQIIRFSIYLFVFSSCPTFLCFSYFPAFFDIFSVFSTPPFCFFVFWSSFSAAKLSCSFCLFSIKSLLSATAATNLRRSIRL